MRWIPIMNRMIPRKAKQAIATFTPIDTSIDNIVPPWRGKSLRIPLTTQLNDYPVFRYALFYFKNKFNVKRKNVDHIAAEKIAYEESGKLKILDPRVYNML
jgi:hypothetical protein